MEPLGKPYIYYILASENTRRVSPPNLTILTPDLNLPFEGSSVIISLSQRVLGSCMVECRVFIVGILIMISGSIPHNST